MKSLICKETIAERIGQLGDRVSGDYAGRPLLVVGVMTGAFMLLADLARHLRGDIEIATVKASSYQGVARGIVSVEAFPACSGKSVLLVDDVFDSGYTLAELRRQALVAGASDVASLVLLEKRLPREGAIVLPRYSGFYIGEEFVVGYGMGLDDRYRHLPEVFVVEGESDAV